MDGQTLASPVASEAAPFVVARDLGLADLRMSAYQHVSLSLAGGKAHAICAEDKAGKTELLLTLAGRMRPSTGSLVVAGNDLTTRGGMRAVRRMAGLGFFEHVNDVERVLRVRTIASAELGLAGRRSNRQATERFLAEWNLSDVADKTIEDLPRFTYDWLGIALAMAHDPRLLVVDDIERDLTEDESQRLCDLLRGLSADRGVTVVCGVIDYDLAVHLDSVSCLTDAALAQKSVYGQRHMKREVA